MTDEQPSQWARELFHQVHRAYVGEAVTDHQVGVAAAALTIQRAFAEREAELVGAAAEIIDRTFFNYNGRECYIEDDGGERCVIIPHEAYERLRAALKSREAGHG